MIPPSSPKDFLLCDFLWLFVNPVYFENNKQHEKKKNAGKIFLSHNSSYICIYILYLKYMDYYGTNVILVIINAFK